MFKRKNKVPVPDEVPDLELSKIDKRLELIKKEIARADNYEKLEKQLPEKSKTKNHIEGSGKLSQIKDRFFPERTLLINMELRNGMHTSIVINTTKNHFKYMGGTYVIDPQLKYFHVASRTYALDYHQDFALPIKREIEVKDVKQTVKELGKISKDEVVSATNPSTLDAFIEGKVIEQLMKAQDIDQFFKNMKIIFIAILVVSTIHFLLFLQSSGVLENMKGII